MQFTERPTGGLPTEKEYKYSLLEEECKYLRDKFYEHCVRHHRKDI